MRHCLFGSKNDIVAQISPSFQESWSYNKAIETTKKSKQRKKKQDQSIS
jgi:hypothetical protein